MSGTETIESYAYGTFIDHLERVRPDGRDFAAGVAAHVLRRWKEPGHRAWFARCMRMTAEMIEENADTMISRFELPRTTVRRLKEQRAGR